MCISTRGKGKGGGGVRKKAGKGGKGGKGGKKR